VWTGGADAPPVFVPAGTWRVTAELDRARAEQQVNVTAGAMVDTALVLGAGKLRVKANDRDGGPAIERVTFRITEDDADSPDGRREVARSTAPEPEFTLSAGTYYVTARHGQAEVRERVLVNAGDEVTRTLTLALGRLGLQSRIAGASTVLDSGVTYTIDRLDSAQDPIRTRSAAAKLELPAGQYRVVSQLGGQNVRVARDLDVKAGVQLNLIFDHVAANIQLKVAGAGARTAAGDVSWDVRDAQDRSVWQTVQSEPRAFLAAGRYKITAESRDRRGSIDVEIKGGEARTIEVPID
jgi:Ca-activated chloride channel homolog